MNTVTLLAVIFFCIIGMFVVYALKSACKEGERIGNHLMEESLRYQKQLAENQTQTQTYMKAPDQVIITEQYETPSTGRQLTEYELRDMIYKGVGAVLEKKMDQADFAAKFSEQLKKKLDIRVKD